MSQWQYPPMAPPIQRIKRKRNWKRRTVLVVAIAVVSCALLVPLSVYGHYETDHDIPNPFWGTFTQQFTYTPEQGPPGGGLLVSRPDVIVRQYLADYIRVAGTYPCAQDLHRYLDDEDPVLKGQRCPVTRPVASFAIAATRVYVAGLTTMRRPAADVRFSIAYADGHSWASTLGLRPHNYDLYFLAYTNQDCWSAFALLLFYPRVVSQAPPGAQYPTRAPDGHVTGFRCQPAQTAS